jgi:hypothetical protein
MLPAPTSIAATPSTRIQAPWNPAVPPPPVAGATFCDGVAGAAAVAGTAVGGLVGGWVVGGEESGEVGGMVEGGGETGDVAGGLTGGEDGGSAADVFPVVQAEIAAEASMATMAQPSAASLALSPVLAVVVRPRMETPRKRRGP